MGGRCHSLVGVRSCQRRHRRKAGARRSGVVRGVADVRADHGEGGGAGSGSHQVERHPLVGQMVDHVRPASVSCGQDMGIVNQLPVLRRACCAGLR